MVNWINSALIPAIFALSTDLAGVATAARGAEPPPRRSISARRRESALATGSLPPVRARCSARCSYRAFSVRTAIRSSHFCKKGAEALSFGAAMFGVLRVVDIDL